MTQGRWMAGCAEGGEQSFLFSLYSQLGQSQLSDLDGVCPCPSGCGQTVKRQQSDFFAIYVSLVLDQQISDSDSALLFPAQVFHLHPTSAK